MDIGMEGQFHGQREDVIGRFRDVLNRAQSQYPNTLTQDATASLVQSLHTGIERQFLNESFDEDKVAGATMRFENLLTFILDLLTQNGIQFKAKDAVAFKNALCPGFWPIC
jgi:hypothetical protein